MIHKLSVLFIALASRSNEDGVPIYCRVTLNGNRKDFATGIRVKDSAWDQEKQRIRSKDEAAELDNNRLLELKTTITNVKQMLVQEDQPFDVTDLIHRVLNPDTAKPKTLMDAFDAKLASMSKLIGKGIVKATHRHYNACHTITREFLQHKYSRRDLLLSKVDVNLLHNLEEYLKTERRAKQVHANKVVQRFKNVVRYAIVQGWIKSDPFAGHRFKSTKTTVVYLTRDELDRLSSHHFVQERLSRVRDIFLFSVYTGLHYKDAAMLTHKHIVRMKDEEWIVFVRAKTGVDISIPYLPQAKEIQVRLQKYCDGEHLLPRISNEKINSYLKEIADIVGIDKNLTHKIARKTFASTVLLGSDVPMAVVSNLLGHSSVKVTQQHYAKVDLGLLSKEMKRIAEQSKLKAS